MILDNLTNKELILQEIISEKNSTEDNNLKRIIKQIEKDGGKPVEFLSGKGLLVGAVATIFDYYYLYLTTYEGEIKLKFSSCVGKYRIIENDELNGDLIFKSRIEFLQEYPENVINYVKNKIENSLTDVLFTDVIIIPKN